MANPRLPDSRDYRPVEGVLAGALTMIVVVIMVSGCGPAATPTGSPIAAVPSSSGASQQTPIVPTQSTPVPTEESSEAPPSASPATEQPGVSLTNPITIRELPFKYDGNNRRAPSPDASVVGECEASEFGNHAVWFAYSPSADTDFGAWVSGSTGYAELWAFEQDPGSGSLRYIGCSVGPYTDALWFPARAGSRYLIMLTTFAHQGSGGRGGAFTFEALDPGFPVVSATFDPLGTALRGGEANLSGTISCSSRITVDVLVQLYQDEGGFGGDNVDGYRCTRRGTPWFFDLELECCSPFAAGPADAWLSVDVCVPDDFEDPYFCRSFDFQETITLRAADDEPEFTPSPSPPIVAPTDPPPEPSMPPPSVGPTLQV